MGDRDDIIKRLRDDSLYKMALAKAKDDKERAQIAAIVEGMVGDFAARLGPITKRVQEDPVFAEQLRRAVVEGEQVLTDIEPVPSGSSAP